MKIAQSILDETKRLAQRWQEQITNSISSDEKRFHDMMKKMLDDPKNKIFLIELLDQSFRSNNPHRIADQLEYIFEKYDGTDIFTAFENFLLLLFRYIGIASPSISVPLFIKYLRNDISNIVIKGETSALNEHLKLRRSEGTRVNINIIGEVVLGEEESMLRIQKYTKVLENPFVDYVSIKISTIFSQISPMAYRWSVEQLKERLRTVYKAAMENPFYDKEGIEHQKFINLDMEEYRDVHLTLDAFKETLIEEDFMNLHAGIVLQSYLPDSFELLKELCTWAQERVKNGGVPIKVRLVKGANQEMELTEASLRNWECVTYLDKADTDANYKLMMNYLLDENIAPFIHVGIASHNLFDHALALLLAKERRVEKYHTSEMLEGMSEAAYHLFKQEGMDVILYAPTATAKTFTNAIAYLVRRFDENTAEQNFLRHSFGLKVQTPPWDILVKSFDDAIERLESIRLKPFREQDRNASLNRRQIDIDKYQFINESDTDFSLAPNQQWASKIVQKWKNISKEGGFNAHAVIAAEELALENPIEVIDKSQFHEKVIVGSYSNATTDQIERALQIAKDDPDGWRTRSLRERKEILMQVADVVREKRGDLIGVAAAEVGKIFSETDVEVSEAIDFLNFYPQSVEKFNAIEAIATTAKGVGLVISPWNFPVAIPVGGVTASLAAGNTVILKPSSDSVLSAYALCQCFWEAGISKNTLQFVPVSGKVAGEKLIPSKLIDFVIFTGSEGTAYEMLKRRPNLHLSAETGGKDATIVTAMADHDQAIKNVVASAFNNSGQKCSATSLLVLERELYESSEFKQTLIDATSSLNVGSVWQLQNRIGPLVRRPSGNLKRALEYLDEGEKWEIAPSLAQNDNPFMLKPSIRWGTKKNYFCHLNELFGPVLSVMCADDLDSAIDIVNSTGYGLTSGLESLDEREQKYWTEHLKAGNLYINRGTTGAIVLRQPFGGMGKSVIGIGKKAGGFNYVSQFMNFDIDVNSITQIAGHNFSKAIDSLSDFLDSDKIEWLDLMAGSFAYWYEKEFSAEHDYVDIRGESNSIRYLNVKNTVIRVTKDTKIYELIASVIAAKTVGANVTVSTLKENLPDWFEKSAYYLMEASDEIRYEDDETVIKNLESVSRVRCLNKTDLSVSVQRAANEKAVFIASDPFVAHGRIELMNYLMEQSITNSYHRYGNLGLHALKKGEK